MNRKWILPLVIGLCAGLAAFGAGRLLARGDRTPSLTCLQDAAWLTKTLNLTAAQAADIQSLQLGLKTQLGACDAQHCAVVHRLGQAMFTETNAEALRAPVEELVRIRANGELAVVEHIRAVHQRLTAEQRQRYERLVMTCICPDCAKGGKTCP